MNLLDQIQKVFGIPVSLIRTYEEDQALCLVHKSWLRFLRDGQLIPKESLEKEIDENLLSFFFTSERCTEKYSWKFLTIQRWNKKDTKVQRFSKPHEEFSSVAVDLSYSQLINYITKTNYKNLWEQAWKKYHITDHPKKSRHKQDYNDALREILKRLYKCQHAVRDDGIVIFKKYEDPSADKKELIHPNLMNILCAAEDDQSFLLLYNKNVCTLRDCLMFSYFILSGSTIRPLFVIYQVVQSLCCMHNQGLFMGPISLSDISINENLWIQVTPCTWKTLLCKTNQLYLKSQEITQKLSHNTESHFNKSSGVPEESTFLPNICFHSQKETDKVNDSTSFSAIVQGWVDGNISNFDYLMELNRLAGRKMNNPHCHYIMPWIMDFSVPEGGWRDLTKSKFRLNKGDKQLDLIYESSIEAANTNMSHSSSSILQVSAITVPHHTSEALADITYYVYKARRMPKTFLCQHVRQKWVPAEYPSTIERLQEWTPDECIPEFFSDAEIFYSIHPDLCDLGVPWWCDGPDDFIKKHRDALEGYHVSERLHHWIDLVFGYKLTGTAALKSKNLCLPLVDDHISVHNHGMVQLFSHPHPYKLSRSLFSRGLAPKTFRSVNMKVSDAKDSGDDDTSSESLGKPSFLKGLRSKQTIFSQDSSRWESRPENQTIVLPKDFNPLAALTHFESLFSFLSWAGGKGFDKTEFNHCPEVCDLLSYHVQDMLVLGCLISEIAVFDQSKTFPENASIVERYNNSLQLLKMHKPEIPRSVQSGIQLLLQLLPSCNKEPDGSCNIAKCTCNIPPVTNRGLPFPSPHQLLIPSIPIISFPSYFPELYFFLRELNNFSQLISVISEENYQNIENPLNIESVAEKKVFFAAEQLTNLLPMLNTEAVELLIPYIQEMFENPHTALLATWHLFGIITQALGPQQTCKHLLKHLTKVFDADSPSPKHLKLFHRTFLLQLIVGLGLHNFLIHFTTILIEAIGGCKDYSVQNSKSDDLYLQKSFTSNTHKLSSMSEDIEDSFTDDIPYDDSFLRSKALSQEGVNLQSAVNNEEDNEIFELDVNEEVLTESDRKDLSNQRSHLKELKNEEDIEININLSCVSGDDSSELENGNILTTEAWNLFQDAAYSQSAPASTSHLTEWSILSGESSDKSENISIDIKSTQQLEIGELAASPIRTELGQDYNVSDVSAESMLWLAHRLGPVLTARYLTRNLLRMLTLCYDSPEKREVITLSTRNKENMISISCKWLRGDLNAFKVLDCLSRIASLYGEQFIMLQYVKHIADLLNLCKKRIPASLESGLHGAMALLHHIIPYMSDIVLMDYLQDILIKDILFLVLRLISSLRIVYPSGGKSRTMIALRMLDVIYTIGLRIGFEMTRMHLSVVLQKFFSCFDKVYNERCEYKELDDILGNVSSNSSSPLKQQALEEMRQTFTPEIAFLTYIPFCKLTGGIHMEKMLKNDELIRNLCLIHDKNLQSSSSQHPLIDGNKSASTHMTHHRDHSLGQDDSFVSGIFGKNVNVIGNRLDVHLGDESHLVMSTGEPVPVSSVNNSSKVPDVAKYDISLIKRKMDNCYRHLKGNWLAYWEHETGRSEKDSHFDFKQIKLQTFVGHTGTVRTIQVLDNENSFLTSSKDKTVKLWSLRSCGDGSAQIPCQWTYTQHRKSVFAVSFLDSLRLVGSCDSTVHIWDPFLGSCIKQLEPSKGSPITVLTAMPAPSTTFLAATTNSTIKFLDARTCRYMHEFKVSVGTTGLIRCLAASPNGNWLAVGHSTGMLSVLDIRTGLLIGTWLGHEGEILQLKPFNNSFFVSSSLDHGLTVWKYEDTQAKCHLKGPMEPVTSLCFYGNEVISGTTGNRVGLHSSIDKKGTYTSTRLRSDTFKGMLTTMALLPLNRLLLLGTDNGNVVLLS